MLTHLAIDNRATQINNVEAIINRYVSWHNATLASITQCKQLLESESLYLHLTITESLDNRYDICHALAAVGNG